MPYILEVQKFNPNGHTENPEWNGKSEHLGYINKVFKSKKEASEYYNRFNPHMRNINADNNWCSDWDPESFLMYIVRERFYEYLKLPPLEQT